MDAQITVSANYDGIRLDSFLAQVGAYDSRSLAAKFCKENKVLINGEAATKKDVVVQGDIVEYIVPESQNDVVGQDIPLDIRFEDEHIIVLSKQPGLVCHPAHGHLDGTLVNALVFHCGVNNLCNIQADKTRLGIVHRLDADTSGLMICAKTNEAGLALSQAMKDHSTSRHYIALVHGTVKQDTGRIEVPLLRVLNKRPKMIASNDPKAKSATTSFEVLERIQSEYGNFTLLDCKIHTGRTHQIRAHMEYINHPVFGDQVYNNGIPASNNAADELGLTRQFLHSYKIGFTHPITGQKLTFKDELPQDLQYILNQLKHN